MRASSSSSFLLRSSRDVKLDDMAAASTPSSVSCECESRDRRAPARTEYFSEPARRFGVTEWGAEPHSRGPMRAMAPRGFARSGSWAELGGREGSGDSGSSSPRTPSKSPARLAAAKEDRSMWTWATGAMILVLVALVVLGAATALMSAEPRRYVVILDGGSQGTRAHVYAMRVAPGPRPRHTEELGVMRVKPGLSSFVADPPGAGESLRPLYEFARGLVPDAYLARTPIVLMATAGLRSVPDRGARDAILRSCRASLARSPFLFRDGWAEVIAGSKEGLYAWVAANYAADSLFARDPRHTLGVLELGGASMQVTFKVPEDSPAPPDEFTEHIHVPTVKPHPSDLGWAPPSPSRTRDAKPGVTEITVYTHSALGLGQEAAFEAHERSIRAELAASRAQLSDVSDPCIPVGYVPPRGPKPDGSRSIRPGGNFTACVDRARALLGLHDPCPHERCGMKGSYLPPSIRGEMLATENFFYTARFLGLPERATIAQMAGAGERVCGAEWRSLVAAHLGANKRVARGEGDDETFEEDEASLARYCFSSSLIVAALSHGLKLPPRAKIRFSNSVGGVAVDWAMGAAIAFTAAAVEREEEWLLGPDGRHRWTNPFGGVDWRILVFVSAVLVLALVSASSRSRRAATLERRIRAKVQAWGSAGRLTRSEGTFGSLTSFKSPAKDH